MKDLQELYQEYFQLLGLQRFEDSDLDYSIFEKNKPFLDKLAQVNNSGITVFDLYKKEHIYTSYNFHDIFGYDLEAIEIEGNEYFNSKVHPEDFKELLANGIRIMRLYYSLPPDERTNYKFVNEYRIAGKTGQYVRVIEQQQTLELDNKGQIWLALGILDISPDQTEFNGIKSQMYNVKTGEVLQGNQEVNKELPSLSKRERQILLHVKEGLLSKEISDKLSISVHTVNTHRQRILEKLGANNSMEASSFASKIGLI